MPESKKIIWLTGGASQSGKTTAAIAICDHYSTSENVVVVDLCESRQTVSRFMETMKVIAGSLENDLAKITKSIAGGTADTLILDLPANPSHEQLKSIRAAADLGGYQINTAFTLSRATSSLEALKNAKSAGIISISDQTVLVLNHYFGTAVEFEKVAKSKFMVELTDARIAKIGPMPRQFYSVIDILDLAFDMSPAELFDLGPLTVATATELNQWLMKTKIALGLPPAKRRDRTV